MPRFIIDETKEIQAPWWDEDETVVIKKFSYGDRQKLAGSAVRIDLVDSGNGKPEALTDVQVATMNLAILELAIVDWTFRHPTTGKKIPVRRQWIEALSEEDGDFILAEINAYNPRRKRSKEEQASFRGAGRGGVPGGDGAPAGDE
jgi:hypothetical protein